MSVPAFIDGVLVYRAEIHGVGSKDRQFSFHRYSFPITALKPGAFSPVLQILPRVLGIRVLYTPDPETTRGPDITSFLEYWLYMYMSDDLAESPTPWARHTVFFRDDFKPLYPKHAEALWRFCDRLFLVITAPQLEDFLPRELKRVAFWLKAFRYQYPEAIGLTAGLSDEFEQLVGLIKRIWEDYCSINNFNAFFELYRREKLLRGDPSWRDIRSLV